MDGRRTIPILLLLLSLAQQTGATQGEIWRSDRNGEVEYSDRYTVGARRYPHPLPPILRTVERVIDGDTVRLTDGRRVRLVAINAPELHDRRRPAEPGARTAREFLRRTVEGRTVRLQLEQPARDRYGRLRAHLKLEDGRNVNEMLLAAGHAHLDLRGSVPRHLTRYRAAEQEARSREAGIWRLPRFQPMPGHRAADQIHGYRFFHDRVERVGTCGEGVCLVLAGGLELRVVNAKARRRFPPHLFGVELSGREVEVRGWVRSERGKPWIELSHPFQLIPARHPAAAVRRR